MYGLGHLGEDRHEFTFARRRQSRRQDVRLHHRQVSDQEWIVLRGLPVTRPARIVSDLLYDREDPSAVAHIVGDALRGVYDYPGTVADALGPHAARFGLRRGDGLALLRWLLDLLDDLDTEHWMSLARATERDADTEHVPAQVGGVALAMSRYATPAAFRRALTDKLKSLAGDSRWELPQLQRQFAYDRLLERLYLMDDGWIVKGAVALLARELGVRASIDIDVYRAKSVDAAEADLREAAARDIGDWFRFEIGPRGTIGEGITGVRLHVTASVGQTVWAQFRVDLVGSDLSMVGEPDQVAALAEVDMPDLPQRGYRAYPLVDHVADKVAATVQRYGSAHRPSTRFRDLVDLVAIVQGASIDAEPQIRALRSEAQRRGIALPETFDVPDRALWESGYADEAKRSLLAPRIPSMRRSPSFVRLSTSCSTGPHGARGTTSAQRGSSTSRCPAKLKQAIEVMRIRNTRPSTCQRPATIPAGGPCRGR